MPPDQKAENENADPAADELPTPNNPLIVLVIVAGLVLLVALLELLRR
jgi:hypothetical protein